MITFPKYESYKDSGVDWLDQIPSHWKMQRSKYLFAERDERKGNQALQHYALSRTIGLIPHSEMTDKEARADSLDKYKQFQADDLIMNKMQAWNGIFGYASSVGVVSPDYTVFRKVSNINVRFYHYLYRTDTYIGQFLIESRGMGDAFRRLHTSKFGAIPSIHPPKEDQDRIVAFLDRKTAEIDEAIAHKQRLIELLQEQKAIVINQAVTKGLNPNVPMQDSGIEAIGKIPEHWELKKLSHISRVVRGASPRPAGNPRYFSSEVGTLWITVAEITKDDNLYLTSTKEFLTDSGVKESQFFTKDTVVLTNSGATLGVPKILSVGGCANDGVVALRNLCEDIEREFIYFYLYSQTYRLREEIKQGSGQPNLNTEIVKNIPISVPRLEEQQSIVSFIKAWIKDQEMVKQATQNHISSLRELKQTVIADAVTGKIKV